MRRSATSNSGPLIHLTRAVHLTTLHRLYPTILIPPAVELEVVDRGKERGAADAVQVEEAIHNDWIKVQETTTPNDFKETAETAGLDKAEADVIDLARRTRTPALLDDDAARTFARALGLEVKGSIGIIIQALSEGAITKPAAIEALERLSSIRYLNVDTYRLARREIDAFHIDNNE